MPVFPPDFPDDVDDTGFDTVIIGTNGKDSLAGTAGRDHILGGNADDAIFGNPGDDWLEGGNGNDRLSGGLGRDRLEGGAGNDTYVLMHDTSDTIVDSDGNDLITSTTSQDLRHYTGIERLQINGASRSGATAIGTDGDNVLVVSAQSSIIDGGAGNDQLIGSAYGRDIFIGGLGRDVMDSGYKDFGPPWYGQDMGYDRFDFRDPAESAVGAQRDVIYNFLHSDSFGGDQINLGAMDANTTINGNQAFTFIGDAFFSLKPGELRLQYFDFDNDARNYSVISGDVDGDGAADFQIEIHTMYLNSHLTMANDIIL